MQRKFDFIDILGFIALGSVIILMASVFGMSIVSASPSIFSLVTGWLLLFGLASLWVLPLFGQKVALSNRNFYKNIHRALGIGFLLVMIIHSRAMGYMMLMWLFGAILVLTFLALLHSKIHGINNPLILKFWWCSHIGVATLITVMSFTHVYAQYAYAN